MWRTVAVDDNYEVSSSGQVARVGRRSTFKAGGKFPQRRILKPGMVKDGYLVVCLSRCGQTKTHAVHHLVADAFLDRRPSMAHEINHKNSDKTDNRSSNLEWVTRRGNIAHSKKAGTFQVTRGN